MSEPAVSEGGVSMPRLLIVDDDSGIRHSLARIMRLKHFAVELAADGESAVELARRFRPDLLILDVRLPGMDGVDTFSAIRGFLPSVPGVFMTAYTTSERARAAHDLGAVSVCPKPLDITALVGLAKQARETPPVLIVDDDRHLLVSLSRALRVAGVSVDTAGSVQQALHCVRQRPDRVVIADIFLNDGFGYELSREMAKRANVYPLLLVTGRSEWWQQSPPSQIAEEGLLCLSKPLDVDSLLGRIRAWQWTAERS